MGSKSSESPEAPTHYWGPTARRAANTRRFCPNTLIRRLHRKLGPVGENDHDGSLQLLRLATDWTSLKSVTSKKGPTRNELPAADKLDVAPPAAVRNTVS